jgi:hypothetical protein
LAEEIVPVFRGNGKGFVDGIEAKGIDGRLVDGGRQGVAEGMAHDAESTDVGGGVEKEVREHYYFVSIFQI